jgi:hypothetical protein
MGEGPMIHKQLSNAARCFKQIFSEQVLNALGKSTRFCQRVREITPYRLALGLIEVFSTMRVETIADVHRGFNALCERKVQYKPFHNQLVKEGFPIFTRNLCERLMEQLTVEVLRFTPKSPKAHSSAISWFTTARPLASSRRSRRSILGASPRRARPRSSCM